MGDGGRFCQLLASRLVYSTVRVSRARSAAVAIVSHLATRTVAECFIAGVVSHQAVMVLIF